MATLSVGNLLIALGNALGGSGSFSSAAVS